MDVHKKDITGLQWERETDGEIPMELLMESAEKMLMEQRNVYLFAEENGYVSEVNKRSIEKRMEEENQKRAEKIEKGETVYGLMEFSFESYLDYETDSFEKRYCTDHNVTEEEYNELLKTRYNNLTVKVEEDVLYDFTCNLIN